MNWERLLTSPPPSTGWDLSATDAVIVHRSKSGELHCAAEQVPAEAFEVGAVGLQAVDRQEIVPVLTRLKGAAEGTSQAAVVLPTSWMRAFLLEVDRLPRKENELHDVIRWRLRKLLPVPPTDLRLSPVRLPELAGKRRLLVLAGIERAMVALESSFKAIGIEPGLLTTRLFSLVPRVPTSDRPLLVIQVEAGSLALVLLTGGVPRLLRTKPLPPTSALADAIFRELRLNLEFIRDKIGIGGEIEVRLVCDDAALETELRQWIAGQNRLAPYVEPLVAGCGPAAVADRIGAARLSPAVAVVSGEVR